MGSVSIFLLTIAGIFLIGIIGELVFARTGLPDVIWLLAVGLVLGPITGAIKRSSLLEIAPYFGALTLVVVLFDGGSKLQLHELRKAAARGGVLALLSFVISVGLVTPIAMLGSWAGILPQQWTWMHALTLGTILGGPSSVVIMPALRNAKLPSQISNIANLESSLTDVLCVVSTVALVRIMKSGSTDVEATFAALGKSFGVGLGVGLAVGLISLWVLRRLQSSTYAYPLVLGTLLVVYVLIDELGGSAALGILAIAICVGNAPSISKAMGLNQQAMLGQGVSGVHDQIAFIIKSFFFTFIGAMLGPPWGLLAFGAGIGVVLLVARVPSVAVGMLGAKLPQGSKGVLRVLLPRGMAAGVLAMLPAQEGIPGMHNLPVVVFAAVVSTVVLFAIGFPTTKKRLAAAVANGEAGIEGDSSGGSDGSPNGSTGTLDQLADHASADDTVVDV